MANTFYDGIGGEITAWEHSGVITVHVSPEFEDSAGLTISPDSARLLALRLIRLADQADAQ